MTSSSIPPPLPEPFIDASRAAEFLRLKSRRVLELARAGRLPAYPLGDGVRRVWRFRLSELSEAMARLALAPLVYESGEMNYGSKPAVAGKGPR